ncbi:Asp-tRNA(Asn)/Glu-tRNA(Gln) amidotransferase subunit GatC [Pseudomonadales bacterium]|nr:Asp-tRNA(Asn)/Glu-tRNA(Gln) amidotransferase subunit GatC [Pseudomonadales bacterium]MDB4068882.1 Asp-tRNA(Asn)/Glu-tRNA(Gln) amidotransferase subunit GatC [Pseudomonadales bacterium]MDB4151321.1 Asp-tRNA(Asn)/Glu-tRNA(Gln) amidotransferase subunit GatC [Pseudomonadales bacterium]MDB9916932.1 Asp-tRNA(Asn)/Glu-tRNA(Gln) amidotransferase subunit GatC [Pseudomonadales bacterium]MDC1307890.1 Asp-tRNA(Asn)/Glu-tRNA(Gln) amidotransferase subunit GatC [Pseudomonadales bacterium]
MPPITVTQDLVLAVAELSQLNIDGADIDGYAADMTKVLALVEQMHGVDTSDIAPMSNPTDASQQLRADEVTEPDQRERFQAIAPETDGGFYLVPRVVE